MGEIESSGETTMLCRALGSPRVVPAQHPSPDKEQMATATLLVTEAPVLYVTQTCSQGPNYWRGNYLGPVCPPGLRKPCYYYPAADHKAFWALAAGRVI